jgi:hypothetical protein
VGTDGQVETYFSGDKRDQIANNLAATVSQIGYIDYNHDPTPGTEDLLSPGLGSSLPMPHFLGMGYESPNPPGATYPVGFIGNASLNASGVSVDESKKEAEDVKDWIGQLSTAVKEPNPKKRAELFDKLTKNINDANLNESEGGYLNNRGNLLAMAIAGAVGGVDGITDLRKKGILPDNFCKKVAEMLKARPDESKMLGDVTDWQGGPGNDKTHAYWADQFEGALSTSDETD